MIIEYLNNVKYEFVDNIVIIYLPEIYWLGSWGAMLDLNRKGKIERAKYIIIDFSNVSAIEDGSYESDILRKEFQDSGGIDVVHVSVPNIMKKLWGFSDPHQEVTPFPEFDSLSEALNFIQNKF